jgi:hypothetical protein
MLRILIILISLLLLESCQSQVIDNGSASSGFASDIQGILSDSSNSRHDFPKPPAIPDYVLKGLAQELKDDSALFYFDRLSPANLRSHADIEKSMVYFKKYRYTYSILALTVHWNPDTRISALKSLYHVIMIRPLICAKGEQIEKLEQDDRVVLKFLVYLLESNPLFITGSENSTIHESYISNILWNLDLITGEKIVNNRTLHEWYKNDLQLESDVLRWKQHIKKQR